MYFVRKMLKLQNRSVKIMLELFVYPQTDGTHICVVGVSKICYLTQSLHSDPGPALAPVLNSQRTVYGRVATRHNCFGHRYDSTET